MKDLRGDEHITKEELPVRLKDAASENPDLFVRLVDEMIRVYETQTTSQTSKPVPHQGSYTNRRSYEEGSRGGRFGRKSTKETDDVSHCQSVCSRSVISYNLSKDEVEVSFDPTPVDEIGIYDCLDTEHIEIEPLYPRDIGDDDASLAKSMITFVPEDDAVEVAHRTVDVDDNASQISNLSYATAVASMIRDLRGRFAGNNKLASGMAKEIDDASTLHEQLKSKGNKMKDEIVTHGEGYETGNLRKNRSRSPSVVKELNVPPTDICDDVSLLSENEFSHAYMAENATDTPVKSKGGKGLFRRFLKRSKKLSLLKPTTCKVAKPSYSEVLLQVTAQDIDTVQPHLFSTDAAEAMKNEQGRDKKAADNKQGQDEFQVPAKPLSIKIAPYKFTHVPTPPVWTTCTFSPSTKTRNPVSSPHYSTTKSRDSSAPFSETDDKCKSSKASDDGQSRNHTAKFHLSGDSSDHSAAFTDETETHNKVQGGLRSDKRDERLFNDEGEEELHVEATVKLDTRSKKEKEVMGSNNDWRNSIFPKKKENSKLEILTDLAAASRQHVKKNPPGQSPIRTPGQKRLPSKSPTNKQRRSKNSPNRRSRAGKLSAKESGARTPRQKTGLRNGLDSNKEEGGISDGEDFLFSVLGTFGSKSVATPKSKIRQSLMEIIDSDEEGSCDDPYRIFAKQESKKPALDDSGASKKNASRWFRKKFMEMPEGPVPTRSIDHSISDGYSQEDSLGSYSSYSMSASDDWSEEEGNPASALLDAVQSMFGVR